MLLIGSNKKNSEVGAEMISFNPLEDEDKHVASHSSVDQPGCPKLPFVRRESAINLSNLGNQEN